MKQLPAPRSYLIVLVMFFTSILAAELFTLRDLLYYYGDSGECSPGIEFTRLLGPSSATFAEDQPDRPRILGAVYGAFLTTAPGPAPGIEAQLGVGNGGLPPHAWPFWSVAQYVTDEAGAELYEAPLPNVPEGTYRYVYRFRTVDAEWVYGDLDGSANGVSPDQLGTLIVTAGETTDPALSYCDRLTTPALIPDADAVFGAEDSLVISGPGTIQDLRVRLDLCHERVGDLLVFLRHEDSATSIVLLDRPGISDSSTSGCVLSGLQLELRDDAEWAAEDLCLQGPDDEVSTARPLEPLARFAGLPAAGTWVLTVHDGATSALGTLNHWCLVVLYDEMTSHAATPTPTPSPTPEESPTPTPTVTPTPSATPTPSPTPMPSPTPTPGPSVDTDGDGYADWYEEMGGHDPCDPADHPLDGDYDGDGRVTAADGLKMYRALLSRDPAVAHPLRGPGGSLLDLNYDGIVSMEDAIILYRWKTGTPDHLVLPRVRNAGNPL